jgi:hypothetical protein
MQHVWDSNLLFKHQFPLYAGLILICCPNVDFHGILAGFEKTASGVGVTGPLAAKRW